MDNRCEFMCYKPVKSHTLQRHVSASQHWAIFHLQTVHNLKMAQRLEAETCWFSVSDSSLSTNNYVDCHYVYQFKRLECAEYMTRKRSVGWMQRGCLEDENAFENGKTKDKTFWLPFPWSSAISLEHCNKGHFAHSTAASLYFMHSPTSQRPRAAYLSLSWRTWSPWTTRCWTMCTSTTCRPYGASRLCFGLASAMTCPIISQSGRRMA